MGKFIRLVNEKTAKDKESGFFDKANYFVENQKEFKRLPAYPYAYWVSENIKSSFEEKSLEEEGYSFQGIITGDVNYFLKLWHEININSIKFGEQDYQILSNVNCYFPYIKGGGFRKWAGNHDYVIKWEKNGDDLVRSRTENRPYFLKEGITWSLITTSDLSFRLAPEGFLCDVSGSCYFSNDIDNNRFIMGFLNSKVSDMILKIINPTINVNIKDILLMPIKYAEKKKVTLLVEENISLSTEDWDSYENSWNFLVHPLCADKQKGKLIEEYFDDWNKRTEDRFYHLKSNEEEINRIFIDSYNLQNEIDEKVKETSISVRKADLDREVKSLISYAVGCIMGRYSLNEEGLIYAGGNFDDTRYEEQFSPSEYGVMPITEEQFFESDLCTRVIDFIKVVYGEDTLTQNLKFIANALKPDSYDAPKKIIRDYLFNDFFDNHYQIYQHRPIYWQLDSGKAGGFRAIVYMHRYNENTLPLVRTEYIQDLRYKYEDEMQRQQRKLSDAKTTAERNAVKKDISSLDKKIVECSAYDDLLNHATGSIQNYVFDLDDGVKNNYAKFLSIDGDKNKNILTVIKL